MKKSLFLSVFALSMVLATPVNAQLIQPQQNRLQPTDETQITADGQERVEGPHFRFDNNVVLTENLSGDVYAAGEKVIVNGDVDGDLMVAGKDVIINGNVTHDLRAAGMNVTVNGTVGGNVSVAGATVEFGPASHVAGSMIGGMQKADFQGEVRGDVYLAAENYDVNGIFDQDVMMHAGKINLMKGAHIRGNLTAQLEGSESQVVNNEAQIDGQKEIKEYTRPERDQYRDQQAAAKTWAGVKVSSLIMGVLVGLFTSAVLLYLFPVAAKQLSLYPQTQAWASLGWGFGYTILTPIAMILLAVTLIGLPLAGLLLLAYIASCAIANWVAAFAIGQAIYKKYQFSWLKNRYMQLFGGLVIIAIIGFIPVVGGLVTMVAFFMGMGAIYLVLKQSISKKRAPVKK